MREKNHTTEEFDRWEAWNQNTYRTGATRPPKNNGGLIAFLLGLVIFLSGISTALGLMNIELFRQMQMLPEETAAPVAFAQADHAIITDEENAEAVQFSLGFIGQTVPEFWCLYQEIPHGVYILDVLPGSDAQKKGLTPGDILIYIDGTPISDAQALLDMLEIYAKGEYIEITVCREGQHITLLLLNS